MEQLKVKKKDVLVLNLIVFLGLSFIFLCLQYAYRHQLSPFSAAYFKKSIQLFWYSLIPLTMAVYLVWKHHRWSVPVYSFCIFMVSYNVIEGLFLEFNKIIVVALFFYVVVAYFLYQLLNYYLSQASMNANYSPSDLFDPLLREIPCSLIIDNDVPYEGYLTNWDDEGCFVKVQRAFPHNKAKVVIQFKGRSFEQVGELVAYSLDSTGVGIKFGKVPKGLNVFNWAEFTELIEELGFKPERLR